MILPNRGKGERGITGRGGRAGIQASGLGVEGGESCNVGQGSPAENTTDGKGHKTHKMESSKGREKALIIVEGGLREGKGRNN